MIEFLWTALWVSFTMLVGFLAGSFITYMAIKDDRH